MPTELLLTVELRTSTAAALTTMPLPLLSATVSVMARLTLAPEAEMPVPLPVALTRESVPATLPAPATAMPLLPLLVNVVRRNTPFRRVYVQSAAGNAGGAIGSAFAVWHKLGGKRNFVMDHAYWGPAFNATEIRRVLDAHGFDIAAANCTVEDIGDETALGRRTAEAIAKGQVVGWFQGRMEWGPRALGNRSILCDPRRPDMKATLNAKIKRRESFRPFAPSVLEEAVSEWFEEDDAVPFMMQVFQIREEKRKLIPAVTHVDGSGRLQTVSRLTNPRYHRLIDSFRALTGIQCCSTLRSMKMNLWSADRRKRSTVF
jgi:predicted NodU family carbamoyl transferase